MSQERDFDPEGRRLPIKIDRTSNGEYTPPALTPIQELSKTLARESATVHAKRVGLPRRAFMVSSMGAATTLLACNRAANQSGEHGGRFAVDPEAAEDPERASVVEGDEFIFDVQTHCVEPTGTWATGPDGERWRRNLTEVFPQAADCENGSFECFSAQVLAREVYLDSDTDVAVVSALWGAQGSNPTPVGYAAEAREIVAALGGEGARALIHGGVLPNEPGELEAMDEKAERYHVDAWKMYPQWGPDGVGLFLDQSDEATALFERARALGVTTIAVHKGLPLPGLLHEYSDPKDMGPAAKANPDLTFLTYHAGFESGVEEGVFDPENARGIDRLIKSHRDAGFARNEGNLYAEMGSMWRYFMTRPNEAAHVMGKLLKHFGEDRIMWGTDSIWYGSPQDQIQGFRTFEISEEFQERYAYPALTRDAKAKIFGLNGARVYELDVAQFASTALDRSREAYRERANPTFATYGPRTRRDFLALWKAREGRPG